MACLKCGQPYRKVEGDNLVCSSCGHIQGTKPTYNQLLSENKALRGRVWELEQVLARRTQT